MALEGILISPRIHKLMLALLHEIVFAQPAEASGSESFLSGVGGIYNHFGTGPAVKWWKTKRAPKVMHAAVRAIRDYLGKKVRLDRQAVREAVRNALKNNRLNRNLMGLGKSGTMPASLFEAYSIVTPVEMAEILWEAIILELEAHIDDWLFVYPLGLLNSKTFHFPMLGASIIATSDQLSFDAIHREFPSLSEMSLETGILSGGLTFSNKTTPSWLFVRITGTHTVAFAEGGRNASVLLGALISAYRLTDTAHAFSRSEGTPNDQAAVFSKRSAVTPFKAEYCGPLLHPILSGIKIDDATLCKVNDCLEKWKSADVEKRRRAEISARWINQASVHGEHVRFLFFFFALDALFGERGRVEAGILDGICTSFPDPVWAQKCAKLFDLRSELVHGGTASIEEWIGYEPYCDHFSAEPLTDIEELSTVSLINYP